MTENLPELFSGEGPLRAYVKDMTVAYMDFWLPENPDHAEQLRRLLSDGPWFACWDTHGGNEGSLNTNEVVILSRPFLRCEFSPIIRSAMIYQRYAHQFRQYEEKR